MEDGFCLCGCGGRTTVADWDGKHHRKGQHRKYLKGHYAKHMARLRPDYVETSSGCWEWLKGTDGAGYGRINRDGERLAHVWMWTQKYGEVPEGKELHHSCENKSCVNPDHLEVLTRAEHFARHKRPEQWVRKGQQNPHYNRWGRSPNEA